MIMKLTIKLLANRPTYSISKLYIDDVYFCDVLEDTQRGLKQTDDLQVIKSKKVYGDTAIPRGTYKITMDVVSNKFKSRSWAKPYGGKLPRLLDVPGYEGVLIHPGNTSKDTLGCILVGKNNIVGQVTNSVNTFHTLMNKLLAEKDDITITLL